MNPPAQSQAEENMAALEARALELQNELSAVQNALAGIHARMNEGQQPAAAKDVPLTPAWDAPLAISAPPVSQPALSADEAGDTGLIFLQALQPYHALRAKWHLGSGLENALMPEIHIPDKQGNDEVASDLRIFGLLSDGNPWEQRIPFHEIARENGVILGRDPGAANYVVDDASISRSHLQLRLDEYGLVVSDLGSTNGTSINDIPVNAYNNNQPLQDGDTLTIGCVSVQVEFI